MNKKKNNFQRNLRGKHLYFYLIVFFSACCLLWIIQIGRVVDEKPEIEVQIEKRFRPERIRIESKPLEPDANRWKDALKPISSHVDMKSKIQQHTDDLLIYFITPTFKRPSQLVDLIRLSQTLMHDAAIYWIVVEDSEQCTQRVRDVLIRSKLLFAHINALTPPQIKAMEVGPKGVAQRNAGLQVVEEIGMHGIVYFGDDDNAYDLRLFPQLRQTQYVSVFGVGFVGGGTYERCVVSPETGKVWYIATNWAGDRTFPLDMAGFAFHTRAIFARKPRFRNDWPMGFLETRFVEQLVSHMSQLQPLNNNCTDIFVWHVKTSGPNANRVYSDPKFETLRTLV